MLTHSWCIVRAQYVFVIRLSCLPQAFLLRYPVRANDVDGDGIMPSLGSDDGPPPFTLAGKLAHGIWLYKSANRDRVMSLGHVREWLADCHREDVLPAFVRLVRLLRDLLHALWPEQRTVQAQWVLRPGSGIRGQCGGF